MIKIMFIDLIYLFFLEVFAPNAPRQTMWNILDPQGWKTTLIFHWLINDFAYIISLYPPGGSWARIHFGKYLLALWIEMAVCGAYIVISSTVNIVNRYPGIIQASPRNIATLNIIILYWDIIILQYHHFISQYYNITIFHNNITISQCHHL